MALDEDQREPSQQKNQTNVNTSGGFDQREQIVYGDQINLTGDVVSVVLLTRLDPEDRRNQRNHTVLRKSVHRFWIESVLKNSLYNEILITLEMEQRHTAVDNRPWDLVLQQPKQPDSVIPYDVTIDSLFEQLGNTLLILGEPGSGKTTTLLTLANALLQRCTADTTFPTPVIFNLSSWAITAKPLAQWLVDELNSKYNMPRKVAQGWVANDELLLLLDGLDEVAAAQRSACVEAINRFRQEHVVGLVVCSRTTEYSNLATRLKLAGAITVRPLTIAQIITYLARVNLQNTPLYSLLQENTSLAELAQSPLLLNVMIFAATTETPYSFENGIGQRDQQAQIFDAYLRRLFVHRGRNFPYTPAQTLLWLCWLATQMQAHNQTIFLIEDLQPAWLQNRIPIWLYRSIHVLIVALCLSLISGLADGLRFGLNAGLQGGLKGVLIGMFFWLALGLSDITPTERLIFSWRLYGKHLIQSSTLFLIVGLFSGWILRLPHWIGVGLSVGLISGLLFGLVGGLIEVKEAVQHTRPNQGIWHSARNMWISGLVAMLNLVLALALIVEMRDWLGIELKVGRIGIVTGILIVGMVFGLIKGGGLACVQHIVLRSLLTLYKNAPLNYTRFLDYTAVRLFIHKVGGGYIFIHRLIMEHIANLTDDDIKRITMDLEK